MAEQIRSLAEALPQEMARVRVILGHYREIGPVGMFGAAFIEADLREADQDSAEPMDSSSASWTARAATSSASARRQPCSSH
jgi:hypothetical protein